MYQKNGKMSYKGGCEKGEKSGNGTSYDEDGVKEYEGELQSDVYDGQ